MLPAVWMKQGWISLLASRGHTTPYLQHRDLSERMASLQLASLGSSGARHQQPCRAGVDQTWNHLSDLLNYFFPISSSCQELTKWSCKAGFSNRFKCFKSILPCTALQLHMWPVAEEFKTSTEIYASVTDDRTYYINITKSVQINLYLQSYKVLYQQTMTLFSIDLALSHPVMSWDTRTSSFFSSLCPPK